GIELTYTDQLTDLNAEKLNKFDGLMIYANSVEIKPDQEKALLDYVESGHGLIPLHCASYCFLNSPKYVALVGAQFQRHGTGTFRTRIAQPDHALLKGFQGFESWDETYVHTKHNEQDRVVLEYREDKDGKEPWSWVRTQGKGRIFYTAWGHDERTFSNPGFHNLVERGVRWTVGKDPQLAGLYADKPTLTAKRTDVKPFEYIEGAKIPFYPPSRQSGKPTDPISKMQKPLAPAESQKHYVMPEGFELQLFASEPQIGKPIAMTWDERGRLWVAETVDYPNEKQPEGVGRDRIRICEDTDGDGRADKFTIFAEKLSIPTSLICVRGGVVVHQAPETLFLKDTNGDDVADVREVLFTGWSVGDTHAGPSNLQYGFDNWLYGIVGYAGFEGTIGGEKQSFRTGFYRFKPDGSKFEFLRNTNNNSWGVGFSEEGVLFGSTANGNPSEYMPIPNRYYEAVRGWSSSVLGGIAGSPNFDAITENVRQVDHHGRFTAAAGHALYTARNYPREYWNRTAFVTEPTGHLIATFVLDAQGAGYSSKMGWDLLASDDEWAAPIVAEVGPDGNVWVIDWYNFIVQHNPTPQGFQNGKGNAYETPLRDKTHGRIYRLVHKDGPKTKPINLSKATPEELVATLKNDNLLWRRHAQRLLVERRKTDVVPQLIALANDQSSDELGLNVGAIHALWTLQGLKALADSNSAATEVAAKALQHPAAGVRRAALQLLPRTEELIVQI
ncbi:MAG TPA: PVC-type heme-binding CxxCH protein, partial [Pirellulaceae bacterium]|nr:PVC-type heme-binding CxxCH protein [Pirellulaceae bacterium]